MGAIIDYTSFYKSPTFSAIPFPIFTPLAQAKKHTPFFVSFGILHNPKSLPSLYGIFTISPLHPTGHSL